jgi:hypothetical protein
LERDGAFKDFPYRDKEKRKEIAVQWSTWSDPRVSSITHSPAATHDDFRKVINDQVDQHGPITREARKKIDKSSDKMWDGIALTGEKAKDLEHPDVYADVGPSGGTFNISDEQPTPATPKTDEKKPANKITKLEVLKTKEEKEEDKRHDEFKNKGKAVKLALFNKLSAYNAYNAALHSYLDKNKAYAEQKAKLDKAKLKADASGASQQDKDSYSAADAELKKLRAQLEKEFQLTAEGQKTFGNLNSAGEATDKAVAAYQPAGLLSKDLLKGTPEQELKLARAEYEHAFDQFLEKNNDYKEFQAAVDKAREKAKGSGSLTDFSGALTNLDHLKGQLEKDFQKTPEGRKALEKVNDTQKAADKTPK